MKQEYWADRLPQVWDEMRKKIRDIRPTLPPGTEKPEVIDDFSFVYGFVLAVSSDGYSYAELVEYVKKLKKDLSSFLSHLPGNLDLTSRSSQDDRYSFVYFFFFLCFWKFCLYCRSEYY